MESASAQVLQEKNIPLSLATEIAQHAVQQCSADHYNVTAAVVDRGGNLRALLRAWRPVRRSLRREGDRGGSSEIEIIRL